MQQVPRMAQRGVGRRLGFFLVPNGFFPDPNFPHGFFLDPNGFFLDPNGFFLDPNGSFLDPGRGDGLPARAKGQGWGGGHGQGQGRRRSASHVWVPGNGRWALGSVLVIRIILFLSLGGNLQKFES